MADETEGAVAEAPASDLAGTSTDSPEQAETASWSFAEPPVAETSVEQVEAPEVKADEPPADKPVEDKFANPFPEDDKRHASWADLRTHADKLLGEVKQYKPLAEKVQALGDPVIIDIVAPLMNISERGPQAVEMAQKVIEGLTAYDGLFGDALKEASYDQYRDDYFNWALEDKGITPETWKQFEAFRENPASFAPPGMVGANAFPEPVSDVSSPIYGLVTITGPDGTPFTLDVGKNTDGSYRTPTEALQYLHAKQDHERRQQDARTKAETEGRTRQQQAQQQQQAQTKAANDFTATCDQDLEAEFTALNINVGITPTGIGSLTETDLAKLMTWGIARTWMDRDDKHQKAFENGVSVARRGGTGRLDSSRLALKTSAQKYFGQAKGAVEKVFRELEGYRKAAGNGTLHESPKIPSDATVFTDTTAEQPMRRPSQSDAYDEIWK